MNKNLAKEIIHILMAIVFSILAVKFLFWLMPIILILICSYYIYKFIKKTIQKEEKKTTKTYNTKTNKKKEIKIIDMEETD